MIRKHVLAKAGMDTGFAAKIMLKQRIEPHSDSIGMERLQEQRGDRIGMITRRKFLMTGAALLGCGVAASYGVVIEPGFRLNVVPWPVAHPGWPASMPPLRIAVLTDLHAMKPWMPVPRIERIVEAANALQPDLIVLLGDYVAGMERYRTGTVDIADWTLALSSLRAPYGVYAVLGNHDWWVDPRGVRLGLEKVGIPVLENDAFKLQAHGRSFWLAGLGDQLARWVGGRLVGVDDLKGTVAQTMKDQDPVILLAHEPDIFVRVPPRITLTLAGHTHGGQVLLPFVGRPIVPSGYGQRFAYGHIVEGGRHMLVSSGLGLSGLPIRFMVPPEIALVTLSSLGSPAVA
jgi:predicted MPP superfamily phosphohydrolase